MVEVEKSALCAFEKDVSAAVNLLVQISGGIADILRELLRINFAFFVNVRSVYGLGIVESGKNFIFVSDYVFKFVF
ncbi:MAG: hypothetical protein BWY69_00745 [Planctomycetes bacterium ADurb.Bin401]|nr:MAG: hypothetical protein BWY69_00745 [Planctomycetes bacterium ADurb.Bin401]